MCASNWEAKGVPVRTIQFMLGHKSLETTMSYLGITNLDSLTDKIDAAASVPELATLRLTAEMVRNPKCFIVCRLPGNTTNFQSLSWATWATEWIPIGATE